MIIYLVGIFFENIDINANDSIYFRVHSIDDGAYDVINWDPKITYKNILLIVSIVEKSFDAYMFHNKRLIHKTKLFKSNY